MLLSAPDAASLRQAEEFQAKVQPPNKASIF